ncbi:ABC-type dipeptide/oligopeptide/nickel transport system, permease component [Opitutaceae bacterium TAV1]|nr:ABC-type dipeptide/oligopeptide/nickel transport system, permease component [Opitutaceae bacterium TAV1]
MFRFIARRLLETIPVLFIIVTVTFFMLRYVPGGPFTSEKAVSREIQRNLEAHYGLDQPLHRQYLAYLWDLCPKKFDPRGLFDGHGRGLDLKATLGIDLGPSFKYPNRTVNEIIADKLPVSLELGGWALLVALVIGVSLGVVAAVRKNSALDHAASSLAMVGICVPTFVLGPVFVLVFAIWLRWLPPSGWYGAADRVLPALTLGLVYAAYVARLTRGGMLEVLNQDFIRTARAKGAGEVRVVFRHALRSGLMPLVSYLGPAIAGVISGSFVIETIFQIPGLGREFVTSAFNRDYTLVLGTVVLYATLIIFLNLVVDVVLVWLNPRLKFE